MTVKIFSNVACSTQIGTGTKASFEGAGLAAAVTANATTTIYGKAFDAASNGSACVSFTSYTHDNQAPTAPGFTALTPAVTVEQRSSGHHGYIIGRHCDRETIHVISLYDGDR